jgi:signal peptidase I
MITLAAIGGIAFGRHYLTSVSVVEGISMEPAFKPGSHVRTNPILGRLERGDTVVIDDGQSELAIKRIIGLPGETVHVWRGYVFINRDMLVEPYVSRNNYTYPKSGRGAAFLLGPDEYFVLGDNRENSTDSRVYGPLQRSQIKKLVAQAANAPKPRFARFTLQLSKFPLQAL